MQKTICYTHSYDKTIKNPATSRAIIAMVSVAIILLRTVMMEVAGRCVSVHGKNWGTPWFDFVAHPTSLSPRHGG